MKKELTIGKWTNKQLAEWFGVSESTIKHNKSKRLKMLEEYADFYIDKGSVIITKVINPIFNAKRPIDFIESKIDETWSPTGLDSCSRVNQAICYKYSNEIPLAESTAYNYTRECRNSLYGKPFQGPGKLGHCEYQWCKKVGNGIDAVYVPFTKEEEKIKQELLTKYFGSATEKQVLVKGMILKGEITEEEAWGLLEELTNMDDNFMQFLFEFGDRIGATVVRGTMVERNAFNYVDDELMITTVEDQNILCLGE